MVRQLSDDSVRLVELARTQRATIRDEQVRECWDIIIEAIDNQWLGATGPLSVDRLADELETGGGITVEEYSVDVDYEGNCPDRVAVEVVHDRRLCSRTGMIRELRRLGESFRSEGGQTRPSANAPPCSHGSEQAGAKGGEPLDATLRQGIAAELQRVLAILTAPANPADVERVRDEAQGLLGQWFDAGPGPSPDLLHVAEKLATTDRSRLAGALKNFADWAEQPEHFGSQVDLLIADLERTLGPIVTPGQQADQRATEERMHSEARDSIALRLREAGAADQTDNA